jgi:hypothetical protein
MLHILLTIRINFNAIAYLYSQTLINYRFYFLRLILAYNFDIHDQTTTIIILRGYNLPQLP